MSIKHRFQILILFVTHSTRASLGSRGCPTLRKIRRIFNAKRPPPTPQKKRLLPQKSPRNDQMLYLFKSSPSYFKKSSYYYQLAQKMTKLCIYSKRPLILKKQAVSTKKRVHRMTKFNIHSKRFPHTLKKNSTKLVFIQNAPSSFKKAVTITKDPIKRPYFVCFENALPPSYFKNGGTEFRNK